MKPQKSIKQKLKEGLKQLKERNRIVDRLIETSWPEQLDIINYSGGKRSLALHGTRRTAKTSGIAIRFIKRAFTEPGYKALFISLTHKNVDRDFYYTCVKEFLFSVGYMDDMPAHLPWRLPNGSEIHGFACDNAADAKKKLRGSKWDDVAVDEAQSWSADIEDLVESIIGPTLRDKRGHFFLLGTPGEIKGGYWFNVNHGLRQASQYDVMRLHWSNNPYIREQLEEWIATLDEEALNSPKFKREYEGLWEVEEDMHVYRIGKANRLYDTLPGDPQDYVYMMGVDCGFNDEFAICIGAWPRSTESRKLFIVETFKQQHLDSVDQLEKVKEFKDKYNPTSIVVDQSEATFIATLNNRFALGAEKSQSRGKREHIELLNADLARGNIQILLQPASMLIPEWEQLIWDRKALEKFQWTELSRCLNHISDATLYMYWKARFYWAAKPKVLDTRSFDDSSLLEERWLRNQQRTDNSSSFKDRLQGRNVW